MPENKNNDSEDLTVGAYEVKQAKPLAQPEKYQTLFMNMPSNYECWAANWATLKC